MTGVAEAVPDGAAQVTLVRGPEKAAILLLFLGEEISAEVFKLLEDEEVTRISRVIARLGYREPTERQAVIAECHSELVEGRIRMRGDLDYASRVIGEAFGADKAREVIERLSVDELELTEGMKKLRGADPRHLAKVLEDEHPQAVALVLAHLEAESAGKIIGALPEPRRSDVCFRLANLEQLSEPVRDQVTDVIAARLSSGQDQADQAGGPRRVAEIFNRMDREMSQETLEKIEENDSNLALRIRNLMFVFNDILLINDSDMRKIIQRVDKKMLVQALKGAAEEVKDHFFRNMSQRAVEMLEEDMEAVGPIKKSDVEDARREVVNMIREMEGEGEISLGQSGGDQYVV